MGLKLCVSYSPTVICCRFKSDQNGIEMLECVFSDYSVVSCSNQTKMGLKWRYKTDHTEGDCLVQIRPKWDWNMLSELTYDKPDYTFKSDQNGIEMFKFALSLLWVRFVQIRPKWDWNYCKVVYKEERWFVQIRPKWDWNEAREFFDDVVIARFKSDQNGIEIRLKLEKERYSAKSSNQTKMGLKFRRGEQGVHKRWKFKSDQNGIEISQSGKLSVLQQLQVQIRPKWDWNQKPEKDYINVEEVQIRPKWDWNGALAEAHGGIIAMFKSDQNGIEIPTVLHKPTTCNHVQIRPKWDWNSRKPMRRKEILECSNQTKMGLKLT